MNSEMDFVRLLHMIPLPVIVIAIVVLAVITVVMIVKYAELKGVDGIRAEVYQLVLQAEHVFYESGQGKQKLKWVVSQARLLLPRWLQIFITEDELIKIIDLWFVGVKDLLDDGKINGSAKKSE